MKPRWDSQVFDHRYPVMDADETREARAAENENAEENKTEATSAPGAGEGEGDNPNVPDNEKQIAERNHQILAGDAKPPRAGEGISRLAGGVATGAGSAAEGIGEGAGSVARGTGEAVEAVGHAAKRIASVGEDARLRSNTSHQSAYALDSGASWGRSGQTESTAERNAETIPAPALQTMGIAPSMTSASTSPTPNEFHAPVKPDGNHNAAWNAGDIFNNTRIG